MAGKSIAELDNSAILQRILITDACGFVGYPIMESLQRLHSTKSISTIWVGSFVCRSAVSNLGGLKNWSVRFSIGDDRLRSGLEAIGRCDWMIDTAAKAYVLAGTRKQ
ncbi:hypothetical protein Pla100_62110 [Neorhodopirellula pilleata]|uniref:Uncharacterized protein n=1 Tax=Neorhodopirellula pilleata TaxID=2714738 RepID=A0A5C5ZFV4_9BACT|nr:hypothetical protein Pla100_62110 [Neorhodopirellula pilleata]